MDAIHSGAIGGMMTIDDRFGHRGGIIHIFHSESLQKIEDSVGRMKIIVYWLGGQKVSPGTPLYQE